MTTATSTQLKYQLITVHVHALLITVMTTVNGYREKEEDSPNRKRTNHLPKESQNKRGKLC